MAGIGKIRSPVIFDDMYTAPEDRIRSWFIIETTFLTRDIVYQAYDQGKAVFGWTASNDDNIKKVIRSEVDGKYG